MRSPVFWSAVTILAAVSAAGAAQLPARYDGNYAVDVATQKGTCQKLSRMALAVDDSKITPVPGMPMAANGEIDHDGHVVLVVRYNDQTARVVGKMVGNTGDGTWTSAPTVCEGRWHAQRLQQ